MRTTRVMAGIPAHNNALYHRLRFSVGDPAAWIRLEGTQSEEILILRDIEMDRARRSARVDSVFCPADFCPQGGLSGDRETATAQALAECLVRREVTVVTADRTMPLIYVEHLRERGMEVRCDLDFAVTDRRSKDSEEIAWLAAAQADTERAVEMACRMIARSDAAKDGSLQMGGSPLTSERVRYAVDVFLLELGYDNPACIIAGGTQGADCHDVGHGSLRTGEPVIVDIFPRSRKTRYNGDCTRTVVHGEVSDELVKMHSAIARAKKEAIAVCQPGTTGEQVHAATVKSLRDAGYEIGLPPEGAPPSYCALVHGTGHGVGLDVHEPPLLDVGGPELVIGDVVTVEPGLYTHALGGIRIEDMIVVQSVGPQNLNKLPEGLDWR